MSYRDPSPILDRLDDIIKERKAERKKEAELRRLHDFQVIQSLNSRNEGGRNPLDILPKELWEKILNELVDHKDLENCTKACSLFRDLLEERRVRDILLPQVLEIDRFTHYLKDNHQQQLLKLRYVCKTWRDATDKFFEKDSRSHAFECFHFQESVSTLVIAPFDMQKLALNLTNFSRTTPNRGRRFFKRSLFIVIGHSIAEQNFFSSLEKFKIGINSLLDMIGHQLLYFRVKAAPTNELRSVDMGLPQIYKLLHEWAQKMPNLKWLSFTFFYGSRAGEQEQAELEAAIRDNPFPHMPNLEMFEMISDHQMLDVSEIYASVLNSNKQVKYITIFSEDRLATGTLPHSIRNLALESLTVIHSSLPHEQYPYICNPNWRLKKIKLSFYAVSSENLFSFLENFPTLEHVEINSVNSVGEDYMGFLQLPNVTHFNFVLQCCHHHNVDAKFIKSIDHLVHMKKLQVLKWENGGSDNTLKQGDEGEDGHADYEIIRFNGGNVDLYQRSSNIWDVFPSLKRVEVLRPRVSHQTHLVYRRESRKPW